MSTVFKISFVLITAWFFLSGTGLPPKLQKKVHKELATVFNTSDYSVHEVVVTEEINASLPAKISGTNLFRIEGSGDVLGYVFLDKAPSKTAEFDYMVVFNPSLEIVQSKVLIYREEYGGEIGSKRWLKQFFGKSAGERVCPKTNIDAISGATISVRSMTYAMDNLLQTIGILEDKNIL